MKQLTIGTLRNLIASLDDNDTVGIVIDDDDGGDSLYAFNIGKGSYVQTIKDTGNSTNTLMIVMQGYEK